MEEMLVIEVNRICKRDAVYSLGPGLLERSFGEKADSTFPAASAPRSRPCSFEFVECACPFGCPMFRVKDDQHAQEVQFISHPLISHRSSQQPDEASSVQGAEIRSVGSSRHIVGHPKVSVFSIIYRHLHSEATSKGSGSILLTRKFDLTHKSGCKLSHTGMQIRNWETQSLRSEVKGSNNSNCGLRTGLLAWRNNNVHNSNNVIDGNTNTDIQGREHRSSSTAIGLL